MSYKYTAEDKEPTEFKERMPYGVSKVKLVGVTVGETAAEKEYVEVTVVNEDGVEDSARVWFVGGASKYSFQTLRDIVIHNAKADSDKEKARQAVDSVEDNYALAELINKKTAGGELWFTKYYSPKNTYSGSDGVVRKSVDRSVYGYEPKLKPQLMPTLKNEDTIAPVTGNETQEQISEGIPSEW